MSLTVEASKLLDFNQKLDIPLLDNVIGFMYNGIGEQVRIFVVDTLILICADSFYIRNTELKVEYFDSQYCRLIDFELYCN